jgi:hypothetical protein
VWRLHIWLTTPIVSSLRPCAQRQDHGVGIGHCSLQSNSSSLIISERNLRPRASAAADSALVGRVWRLGGCGKNKYQLLKFSHFQIFRLSVKSQRVFFDCILTFLRRCFFLDCGRLFCGSFCFECTYFQLCTTLGAHVMISYHPCLAAKLLGGAWGGQEPPPT